VRLVWSMLGQADRNAIFDYIEVDSPPVNVDERIRVQVEGLLQFPGERPSGPHQGGAGVGD
jgi:plasmid stabilization system protein ParE